MSKKRSTKTNGRKMASDEVVITITRQEAEYCSVALNRWIRFFNDEISNSIGDLCRVDNARWLLQIVQLEEKFQPYFDPSPAYKIGHWPPTPEEMKHLTRSTA